MSPPDQFRAAIVAAGLTPPESIDADGKLHRFSSDGRRGDDAGWYVHFPGDIPGGVFGCFRADITKNWRADVGRKLTAEEIAAHKRQMEDAKRKRDAEKKKDQAKARAKATKIWESAAEAPADHPYLVKKGVGPHGLRLDHGELIVSLRDISGELHSLQWIDDDGEKEFLFGGRVSGCYFAIGEANGSICLAEGFATGASIYEATGIAVAVGFNAGNLPHVARELRAKYPDLRLIVCADDDVGTPGNPGMKKAREAAEAIGGLLAVPDFGEARPERASDFNDLHQSAGLGAVLACIERARPAVQASGAGPEAQAAELDADKEIARLAKLRPVEYERERKDAAARLGVRATMLDKIVDAERQNSAAPGQGRSLELPEPEPWPEPVNGAALIDEIEAAIRKFIVCDKEASIAAALWIAATWFADVLDIAPILNVRSPEMRCGKSVLLSLIGKLSWRPILASNISPAALFRSIEKFSPTLILDEAETFLTDNEEARGIINSGHTRQNAFVIRTVGDDHEPKQFSTWGFKAIAGIGKRAATIEDRSIPISLKRRLPDEAVTRLRHAPPDKFELLTRKLARFAQDNKAAVKAARPHMPECLDDRQQDCWEPLFSIAQTAGEACAKKAENAALHICGASADASFGVQLLSDNRDVFASGDDVMPSADLVKALVEMPERSWGECNHGKPLTPHGLARLLKPFDVFTKDVGPEQKRLKGYTRESFTDAFVRYLPPFPSAQPRNRNENNGFDEIQTAQPVVGCAVENDANSLKLTALRGCAVENPHTGDVREEAGDLPPADGGSSAIERGENEAPEQSRQAKVRALLREADRIGLGLHLGSDGGLRRLNIPLDPEFHMKLKDLKRDIIATLQGGGGWHDGA